MPSRSTESPSPDGPSPELDSDAPDFLAIAEVLAPHGVHGEVRCAVLTDFPTRFRRTRTVYVGEEHAPCAVERARLSQGGVLMKLADVDSKEAAATLRGKSLYVPTSEAVPLPDGTYYWHQILGCEVRTVAGESLGSVAEILETGSNDVYVVRGPDREVLIPAIADVIKNVDPAARAITVELLEGLV